MLIRDFGKILIFSVFLPVITPAPPLTFLEVDVDSGHNLLWVRHYLTRKGDRHIQLHMIQRAS